MDLNHLTSTWVEDTPGRRGRTASTAQGAEAAVLGAAHLPLHSTAPAVCKSLLYEGEGTEI